MSNIFCFSQSFEIADIEIGLDRGICYHAVINIDKSTILDSDNKMSYVGLVTHQDPQAAFEISAYPQGQQPTSSNRMNLVAFARNGGHQEISITYQGKTSLFYPDRIKSSKSAYGIHFELGKSEGNVVEQLINKEIIKVDVTEVVCPSNNQLPPHQVIYHTYEPTALPVDPTVGCKEVHDVIESISNTMYKWPNEDKGQAWTSSMTKKLYDLPGGCVDRDREVNKLFSVSAKLYPKRHEDDKRHAWFKEMLSISFERPSTYTKNNLSDEIDDLLSESTDIFDWHENDKKVTWVSKKIRALLNE